MDSTSHKNGNVTLKLDCKKHFHYICHSSLIYFFFLFLEPDVVKNLRIVSVTTTSVSLSWDKPEGSADSYIVRWNSTKEISSNKTNSLSFNITNLTPGVLYNISVTAVAGNEGNQVFNKTFTSGFTVSENLSKYLKSSNWKKFKDIIIFICCFLLSFCRNKLYIIFLTSNFCIHNFSRETFKSSSSLFNQTGPEKPQNISVTANETQSLNISWSLAKGEVEYFAVNISNAALSYAYSITATALKAYFTGLHPGRLYYIVVTSVVGDFRSPSDNSSFATGEFKCSFMRCSSPRQ